MEIYIFSKCRLAIITCGGINHVFFGIVGTGAYH